jgi:alpha-L-fucosidase
MRVNRDAIYSSRPLAPYVDGKVRFTRLRDGGINAIYLADEKGTSPPVTVSIATNTPKKGSAVTMLGVREPRKWELSGTGFLIHVPEEIRKNPPCNHAWTFHW